MELQDGISITEPWLYTSEKVCGWKRGEPSENVGRVAMGKREDTTMPASAPVVVVCGPKNAGKSTFSRFLVNSLLQRYAAVGFLETDIGQPEFTIPGVVSLHLLSEPISVSGPAHLHLKEPEKFHFFGEVNPKANPEYYVALIASLYDHFRQYIHHGLPGGSSSDREVSLNPVPLVVNTHGWIKGIGYDVLTDILRYLCPTHVVKLSGSSASKSLPAGAFWDAGRSAWSTEVFHIDPAFGISPEESTALNPKPALELRNLRILTYFAPLNMDGRDLTDLAEFKEAEVYRQTAESLMKVRPYRVPISAVKIVQLHCRAPEDHILYIINGSLVALARQRSSEASKGVASGSPYECLGFGIVRSVDVERKLLFVLTPLSFDKLRVVDTFLHGKIGLPPRLLQANGVLSPYWSRDDLAVDVVGTNAMRSRNNIKRRSQDKL